VRRLRQPRHDDGVLFYLPVWVLERQLPLFVLAMQEQGRASQLEAPCGFLARQEPLHILQRLHQRDAKQDKKRKTSWLPRWILTINHPTHSRLQRRESLDELALSTLMYAPANIKRATPLPVLVAGETLRSEGRMIEEASGIAKAVDLHPGVFSVEVWEVKMT
jgi:hypothetical protein